MRYRERLWPAWWVFLSTGLVIPAALMVFLPISPEAGVIAAIVLYAGVVVVLLATTATIEVDDRELRCGRARIPLEFVGDATAFRGDEAVAERGVRLDARAWLLLRGWIGPVIRIEITDPQDPTPYWIVSTRTPEALRDAIAAR